MMTIKHGRDLACAAALATVAAIALSCGGTGGGGGKGGNPDDQFFLNSNNMARLVLNVNPTEVDANKSDRLGLVATLTDSLGAPIRGVTIRFSSDLDGISFLGGGGVCFRGSNDGISCTSDAQCSGGTCLENSVAVTDAHGNADIIAVAGTTPTSTGDIVGTGAIFAAPPAAFGLRAQVQVTLLDVGFIDAAVLGVIPSTVELVEPGPGAPVFFNVVGGNPPYLLKNEVSGIGIATISQHCTLGCTENGGVLCVGSPCLTDADCGAGSPDGTCIGPIKRCLASCQGSNCGGSRCNTDADCNDGSPTPANVCKDSGQSIVFIVGTTEDGTSNFIVEDSHAASVTVTVTISTFCGSGVARGAEQCDGGDFRGATCTSLGFGAGTLVCKTDCTFDTTKCVAVATPTAPAPTLTLTPVETPTITVTPTGTITETPTPTFTPAATPTPGAATDVSLGLLVNGSGDNGNGTLTTVIAATVSDGGGGAVADGTPVSFSITAPTHGAVINSPSATNADPPCDVTNFEADTGASVLNQHGVAHTCVTYPTASAGMSIIITGSSGIATSGPTAFTLP